jgi:hypothetical protein
MKTLEQIKNEAKKEFYPLLKVSNPKNEREHEQFKLIKPILQKAFDDWFKVAQKDLDRIVTTAYNAGLEKAVEVVGSYKMAYTDLDSKRLRYEKQARNKVIDDITTQLQAEANKDNNHE